MKLYVLFAQRKETYDGEYAPEALAVADEYTMDESPEWMERQIKEQVEVNSDFIAHTVVEIDLGDKALSKIRNRLIGNLKLPGEVL